MVLTIKDAETEQLARELAGAMGVTLADAVKVALKERLQKDREP